MFSKKRPELATLLGLLSRDLTTFVCVCRLFRTAGKMVTVIWSDKPKGGPAAGEQ